MVTWVGCIAPDWPRAAAVERGGVVLLLAALRRLHRDRRPGHGRRVPLLLRGRGLLARECDEYEDNAQCFYRRRSRKFNKCQKGAIRSCGE